MAANPLIPVILCGGTGTRLWPLSRASYPKQYWPLSGDGDATLLQQTQQRLTGLAGLAQPLLICNEDHRFIVAEQMRQIGVEPRAILLEPMGRNTAPAVTVAALQATAEGEDPLLLVLAADHLIRDAQQFQAAVTAGRPAAEAGRLVTFGIVPTAPETGYGYIEAAEALPAGELKEVPIARFVEKPDRDTAEQFLATGRFTWNSGMFLFSRAMLPSWNGSCRMWSAAAGRRWSRTARSGLSAAGAGSLRQVPEHRDRCGGDGKQPGISAALDAGWSDVGAGPVETSDPTRTATCFRAGDR